MPASRSARQGPALAGGSAPTDAVGGARQHAGGASPASRKDNIPRGIYYMIAATVMFALSSAIAKLQVAIYPVGEVMFFRSFSSLVVCAAFLLPVTGLSVFATRRPRDHIARGLSQSISQTFTVLAFSLMPLAGAIAIQLPAPPASALISIVLLQERARPARRNAPLFC